MKKIIWTIAACTILYAGGAQAYDLQLARDAKTLIQAAGYKCDTVDKANRFALGGGVSVYCNGFRYSYEIKDVGGRMVVIPT